MEDKIFKRICPQCSNEIIHKDKHACIKSVKYNKPCIKCTRHNTGAGNKGRKRTEEFKLLLSQKMKNHPSIKGNEERANKIRDKTLGRDVSSWHVGKSSFLKVCIVCSTDFECQPHRKETNHFCGRACQNEFYHLSKKWVPRFNPIACTLIEEYGNKNGYNFKHALNGGEYKIENLNFWVDGYDEEKNTVIEYNEKHHNTPIQKEKDKIRREKIIQSLKCEFIILNCNDNIEKYKYEK
jgi:hypothetical protein